MILKNTNKNAYLAYKPTKWQTIKEHLQEAIDNQTPVGIELEEYCKKASFEFFFPMIDDGKITVAALADVMKLPLEEVGQAYKEHQNG